jgi:hypothetical protein
VILWMGSEPAPNSIILTLSRQIQSAICMSGKEGERSEWSLCQVAFYSIVGLNCVNSCVDWFSATVSTITKFQAALNGIVVSTSGTIYISTLNYIASVAGDSLQAVELMEFITIVDAARVNPDNYQFCRPNKLWIRRRCGNNSKILFSSKPRDINQWHYFVCCRLL